MISKPENNRFATDNIKPIVSEKDRAVNNEHPEIVQFDSGKVVLYHTLDHVYLKPITSVSILFRIKQPTVRHNTQGKPRTFLETPEDFAMFRVMQDCLKEAMKREFGG